MDFIYRLIMFFFNPATVPAAPLIYLRFAALMWTFHLSEIMICQKCFVIQIWKVMFVCFFWVGESVISLSTVI